MHAGDGGGAPAAKGHASRVRAVRAAGRRAARQPEAVERARRRACTRRAVTRTRRRAIAARCKADPRYAIAHNNLGVALYHGGQTEEAIDAFRARARRRSRRSPRRGSTSRCCCSRGSGSSSSLEAYRQVLAVEPEQPVAWNGIGLVLAELKKYEDARNAFGRAIQARAGVRRGALQPELRALQPRRLRGRAARDEARARARPVLRRAEVRAGDRSRVRGSRSLDRPRPRRGKAAGRERRGVRVRCRASSIRSSRR